MLPSSLRMAPSNQDVSPFNERSDALEVRRSYGLPPSLSLGIGSVPGDDHELHAPLSVSRARRLPPPCGARNFD